MKLINKATVTFMLLLTVFMVTVQGAPLRKYGVEATIDFELFEVDGVDLRVDWTPAQVDCEIMKDGGASTMCTNTATDEGSTYSIVLTATEMEAARLVLKIVDAETKVFLDKVVIIETYGNASSQHAFDLDSAGVDVTSISGGSTAADNLELQYDTTGLTGDTFPATQAQVGNLTSGTAAINTTTLNEPDGFVITVGGAEVNNEDTTHALDGVVHSVEDDGADDTDVYYIFNVGGTGVPVSITWQGYAQGVNDTYDVYARNFSGPAWEQVGSIDAGNGTTVETITFNLTNAHVGIGGDLGKVYLRFLSTDGALIATDRIICSFAIVNQSVGYAEGAIWVDTNNGVAGTTTFLNGTADNPVLTWADALILSSNVGLSRYHIIDASAIQLSAASDSIEILGFGYTIDLNGQSVNGSHFNGAVIIGNDDGSNTVVTHYHECEMGDNSIGITHLDRCELEGDIIMTQAGQYILDACFSGVAGTGTPSIDFGVGLGTNSLNMRHYSGGIEIKNMGDTGTDTMSLEGDGQLVIAATCDAGTVAIRGHFKVTDNASGNVTLSDEVNFYDIKSDVVDVKAETALIVADTNETQGKLPTNKFMGSSDGADDDGTLNDILTDTGTTIPALIDNIGDSIY